MNKCMHIMEQATTSLLSLEADMNEFCLAPYVFNYLPLLTLEIKDSTSAIELSSPT